MSSELHLRGVSSVPLLPAAVVIAVLGAIAALSAGKGSALAWIALQSVVAALGLAAAAVVGSRRITLVGDTLRYRSLTRRLAWSVREITQVTYQGHPSQRWHAHITLHHANEGELRLNVYLWHQREIAALLQRLRAGNAALQLSPAALGYLAVAR